MTENVLGLVLLLIYRSFISNIRKSVLKIESIVSISPKGVALMLIVAAAIIQINTIFSQSP